ncbi:aldo/keto reductase [Solibacillus sp. FSL W7-1472]|uniref:Predicted oxidoreductase n=1 Tax=Solibacillus silvestris (strain StLB046) TaxID=1002809 RepID=F2FAQ2_SOLSS|nr:aldo/keto reductase [Solibacillus silvestris]OBW56610.1 oxidoreductase [Solibacillus silvestris]BAK17218.1 predicted oxidoreductase [Solibacillus silvestris StLB046]
MKKRQLGTSNLHISEISLGCMSLPPNPAEAEEVIHAAIDAGINYFDTADLYNKGENEKVVGTALKQHRHNIYLASKVGNRWEEGKEGWGWDTSANYINKALRDSLQRLQTDYLDLYQLHGGTTEDNWEEITDTFESLKKEGLIREYGISSIRPNVFMPFLQNSDAISNMMQFNIFDERASEFFDSIQQTGASVVTRGSIAKGLLTNEWRTRLKPFMSYDEADANDVLQKIEQQFGDVHAAALAFNLQYPTVASTVIGARTLTQLKQNLDAYEKAQLLQNISEIDKWTKTDRYTEHR